MVAMALRQVLAAHPLLMLEVVVVVLVALLAVKLLALVVQEAVAMEQQVVLHLLEQPIQVAEAVVQVKMVVTVQVEQAALAL
jgi:hypothetical protein